MAASPYNGIVNVYSNDNRWKEVNGTFQHTEVASSHEIPLGGPSRRLDIANDQFAYVENILHALNGFLMILTCDGEVFFATHSIESYLGFHQKTAKPICHPILQKRPSVTTATVTIKKLSLFRGSWLNKTNKQTNKQKEYL
uniref:PAS domain-containing protein n=1 Tax=Glossina austeni TaxID=7395 RepID=A0A1A9VW02_GLOAU